jgi:uncharacterized protein (TIGR03492 family)
VSVRVLFVSNGHGEAAIADRIASELVGLCPGAQIDHLALVADATSERMCDVGPRRAMPSGGLIAMGNVPNIARDLRAGLLRLTFAQYRYLRGARGRYDAAVAVGDVFCLLMARSARAPVVFVGTAKSVRVAPYGAFERRILREAAACFVRDEATAAWLQMQGLAVEPAANVIVDLYAVPDDLEAADAVAGFSPPIALFPGSRVSAYEHAEFLLEVIRAGAAELPAMGAVLSLARGLDVERFAALAQARGWCMQRTQRERIPFTLSLGSRVVVRTWRGSLGPLLRRVALVLGQAGTANEAAAAAGVPVMAFERDGDRKTAWYRKRQRGLLGDAMAVASGTPAEAFRAVRALLLDAARREAMGREGRARMGAPGAARRVAERIAAIAARNGARR